MNFELGKTYIVDVTEKGIVPLMEFDKDNWFHKDYDDLDFLTDEEKTLVVNNTLDKIRAEIEEAIQEETVVNMNGGEYEHIESKLDPYDVLQIIDKYKKEGERK